MGKRRTLNYPRYCREYRQGYQGDSDPADVVDVADLEAEGWKARGALGGPVQVSGDVMCDWRGEIAAVLNLKVER